MSELSMMVTITERSKLTTFLSFYRERQVPVQFISLALGTASNETLNYLGLERSDKCVFASFVTDEKWEELRRGLRRELQIDVPGMGIAFTVPLSSIGGRRELQFLTEHQNYQKGEESTMKDTKYELLVVIANHGYSDLIMDADRGAGAAGGTGGGMLGLFNATMRPGIELVLDLLHAREACAWADVVITGEGSIDGQTPYGKVPSGIARLAKSQGKPVIAIGGKVTRDPNVTAALNEAGIVATFGIAPGPAALPELLTGTKRNVEATCAAIASLLSVARECSSRPHQ